MVRFEAFRILEKAKTPAPNISKGRMKALRNLKRNTKIIILRANKRNATVIMNKDDYRFKIKKILTDGNYKKINKDPTERIERKTELLLKKTDWDIDTIKNLIVRDSHFPRLYELPKIHKPDIPLRPIVSAINSSTHLLAKHLSFLLKPFVENTIHNISNSKQFVEIISKWTDKITNEEALRRVEEKRTIIRTIKQRKANWIGHILRRNGIIKDIIQGKIEGKRSLGRRRLQVLDGLRKKRKYWELKDEAQEREPWRKKFAICH